MVKGDKDGRCDHPVHSKTTKHRDGVVTSPQINQHAIHTIQNAQNVTVTWIASVSNSIIGVLRCVEGRGNSLFSVFKFLLTFESAVTNWPLQRATIRESLKISKSRMHVVNKEVNPVTKKRGRKGQPGGESTDALKQGIAQQGQARRKVALNRWNLCGPGVMDHISQMTVDNISQMGISEIMVKCNWLKCSLSN